MHLKSKARVTFLVLLLTILLIPLVAIAAILPFNINETLNLGPPSVLVYLTKIDTIITVRNLADEPRFLAADDFQMALVSLPLPRFNSISDYSKQSPGTLKWKINKTVDMVVYNGYHGWWIQPNLEKVIRVEFVTVGGDALSQMTFDATIKTAFPFHTVPPLVSSSYRLIDPNNIELKNPSLRVTEYKQNITFTVYNPPLGFVWGWLPRPANISNWTEEQGYIPVGFNVTAIVCVPIVVKGGKMTSATPAPTFEYIEWYYNTSKFENPMIMPWSEWITTLTPLPFTSTRLSQTGWTYMWYYHKYDTQKFPVWELKLALGESVKINYFYHWTRVGKVTGIPIEEKETLSAVSDWLSYS